MFIKYIFGTTVTYLNLVRVTRFETSNEKEIKFYFEDETEEIITFISQEKRDFSIDKIARKLCLGDTFCDLDEYEEG